MPRKIIGQEELEQSGLFFLFYNFLTLPYIDNTAVWLYNIGTARGKGNTEMTTIKNYNFPEIKAVSEKQRKYAEDLRARYVKAYKHSISVAMDILDTCDYEMAAKMAAESGTSEEKIIADVMREVDLYEACIVLISTDARTIIDALK